MTLGSFLYGVGCGLTGLSIGFICHTAKVPIFHGALLLAGILLLVEFHS